MNPAVVQVAQIEQALRDRFFPYVLRSNAPEHAGRTEEQHDTDRLSRSLAAYALVGLVGLDDAAAAGAVTDGRDDRGIDALYYDRPNARLILVQSKFKRNGDPPSQADVQKTINGVRALRERRFAEFNEAFRNRLDEIEEALDTPGVTIIIVVTFLGDDCGPHALQDLEAFRQEAAVESEIYGRTKVLDALIAEEAPPSVTIEIAFENWNQVQAPRKAVYGQISAATLAALVGNHGKKLFERNIRHYLGSIGVNTAIADTVRRKPEDFFYLNNGLTAVAERIVAANGTPARCNFRLENVSIVNGAQTAGAINIAATGHQLSQDAKVLLTAIEIGAVQDDIGLRITRARNHQTAVRGVDFAALDPNQERLRQELAACGITYHYRPSAEARTRRDDAFTLEEAAVALACLSFDTLSSAQAAQLRAQGRPVANAIDFIIAAKKEVGRLWDRGGALYTALFSNTLSGLKMCRLVRVYRFLDSILSGSEWSQNVYARRMFFRHGRYFVMAFVAKRCAAVLNRADFNLSNEDKQALSLATNELGELIYATSEPLQAFKGYLAIFRNLTDSQPLADRVLARIAAAQNPQPQGPQ